LLLPASDSRLLALRLKFMANRQQLQEIPGALRMTLEKA